MDEEGKTMDVPNEDAIVWKVVEMIQAVPAQINSVFEHWQQQAEAAIQRIIEALTRCTFLGITEEHKQELIANFQKWGEYGWTRPLGAPPDFFFEPPGSIEEANAAMRPLCSKTEVERLFEKLKGQKHRKQDLEEAIACYNDRHYKACALILFGMIDAKMIRKQGCDLDYRPVGHKAAKRLQDRFERDNKETSFFVMLHYVNVFACLKSFFANANDFKDEPDTINRNFVSHGMARRPVRQRDCIQLFFVLYNFAQILSSIPKPNTERFGK